MNPIRMALCTFLFACLTLASAFAQGDGRTSKVIGPDGKLFTGTRTDHDSYSAWQENSYKNGLLDGVCKAYDKDGNVLFERRFVKGKVKEYRAVAEGVPGPRAWTPAPKK